ncbi:hypothetical protein [Bradyrhizobium sp. STM 3557]|uniref:hypothetical protein n=1 Tax=Bradyrhizobium sp. STM 3557 TaxID=578920 RepID=UPI00388D61EB
MKAVLKADRGVIVFSTRREQAQQVSDAAELAGEVSKTVPPFDQLLLQDMRGGARFGLRDIKRLMGSVAG